MSRIGKMAIAIPANVNVKIDDDTIVVKGPNGVLTQSLVEGIQINIAKDEIKVDRNSNDRKGRSLHGLMRTLVANMVKGVSEGFKKKLELIGVGYRAEMNANVLKMSLGYSHPINYEMPDGIKTSVEKQTFITVEGADKQMVGEVAAKIRSFRKPDPYKGKGVKYDGEFIRRKAGKTGSK